jgi:ABC-type dipeptide/oligopeptide/nickel transport system permease component
VHSGLLRFLLRRAAFALLLVALVSSASMILAALTPPDFAFEADPAAAAAERRRLGLDRPVLDQYAAWVARGARLDLGESLRYRRPVATLVGDAARRTAVLGAAALLLATIVGIPLGVFTGSAGRSPLASLARGASLLLLSLPSLITSLVLLLIAARTGWLPVGGFGTAWHLVLPALALALPITATLERQQSQAIAESLNDPSILAAAGRGIPRQRLVWRHAFRLSLKPVLAIYGIVVGSALSGSFIVEIVTAWPGLGWLTLEALRARDVNLVAGCASAGALCLAAGILASDLALAAVDPRLAEPS